MNRDEALAGIIKSVRSLLPGDGEIPASNNWNQARDRLKSAYKTGTDGQFLEACNAYLAIAKASITPSPGSQSPSSQILPCPVCSCPTWWRSIYSPELHCRECSPPPSPRLVAEIVNAGDDASSLDESTHTDQPSEDPEQPRELNRPLLLTTHNPDHPWAWRHVASGIPDREAGRSDTAAWRSPRKLPPEPQAHKDPNPGCLRDYRGKGGSCMHLAGESEKNWIEQIIGGHVKITCKDCGKLVGYKRQTEKSAA